jgi:hypothetical protein
VALDWRTDRPLAASVLFALAGLLILAAGAALAPRAAAASYLVAYTATLACVLGMLLLAMSADLSGAVWFVPLRRHAEAVVGALPALAVLMLPLIIAPGAFWPWARGGESAAHADLDRLYFDRAFFTSRAVGCWLIWLAFGELLRTRFATHARASDASASYPRWFSAAGVSLVALAMTLAAFDWMMSVSPGWTSSIYGVYYFAGAMVGALALLAVLAWRTHAARSGGAPTADHFHALGKLMLAFVLFWGYVWYAQYFIIWIADLPREVTWYVERFTDGWRAVGLLLLAGGFAAPVALLLFRAAKRSAAVMCGVGGWLLAVHYVDVYWLLVPAIRPAWTLADALWDVAALGLVAGSVAAAAMWRRSAAPPASMGDRPGATLGYEAR